MVAEPEVPTTVLSVVGVALIMIGNMNGTVRKLAAGTWRLQL
jgi:hypothetical protein